MSWIATGVSVGSAIWGGIRAGNAASDQRKAQDELERKAKNSPLYRGNPSIDKIYNESLARYFESPYQAAQYKNAQNAARRTTATGISGLQSWGSAIGGIGKLASIENNAIQNAGVQAEANSNQRFGQFVNTAQMKKDEDYKVFDINKMTPFNRELQLGQMKSAAAGDRYAAGMQMVGSGLSNAATIQAANIYANPKVPKTTAKIPPNFRTSENSEPAYMNPANNVVSGNSGYTPSYIARPFSSFKAPAVKTWKWNG